MGFAMPPALKAMVDELNTVDDLTDKYEILIELGAKVPDVPSEDKVPANLVHGCQSVVHIAASLEAGKLAFRGHADAMVVNGLLALLVQGLSGLTPDEFLSFPPEFIKETGIIKTLTPSRVNGFYNIHHRMHLLAEGLKNGGAA